MKSLMQVINEGKVLDLPGVKKIRHYTDLYGLTQILDKGILLANDSVGDEDWARYDIGEYKVVSFHDDRYDPEKKEIKKCNEDGEYLGNTRTLGLHMYDICACIEYEYDKLPDNIKNKATIIKILEEFIRQFQGIWNRMCIFAAEYKMFLIKHNLDTMLPEKKNDEVSIQFIDFMLDTGFFISTGKNKDFIEAIKFFERKDLKPIKNEDRKQLLEYAIKRDRRLVGILLKHGWQTNDYDMQLYKELVPWKNHDFLTYVAIQIQGKKRNDKIPIEVRIASDIPIDIPGCTVHIFKGMIDGIMKSPLNNSDDLYQEWVREVNDVINSKRYSNLKVWENGETPIF